jgi:vitamin B12 transporter
MRLLFTITLLLIAQTLVAQTRISGFVKGNKNTPVPGATLTIKDSYDGGTADSLGRFSFTTTEKGDHILVVTGIGYVEHGEKVNIAGTDLELSISLKEEINEMKAVVITAGSFEASDKKRTTVFNSIDIVTTASAMADITGAIKTLPGAQQVGESEGLFVRGGTASETKTFIDGTLVNNFFYSATPNIASRGRFSPFIFKGTVFSAGGYSALYGQALSSALILESIDLPDRSSASLGVSPLGINGGYQSLSKNRKSSWGISYGYANLGLTFKVIPQKPDYFRIPEYHTGEANFRIKTSNTGMIKYYGYFSQSEVGVRNPSLDTLGYKESYQVENFNIYQNLSFKENMGRYWKINLGLSYTNNKDNIVGRLEDYNNKTVILGGLEFKNFDLKTRGNYFNSKMVLERRLKGLSAIRFGSEWNYSNDNTHYTLYDGQQFKEVIKENIISGFAEADIYLTNNLAAKGGTRLEHSSFYGKTNIAPRISLAYKLGQQSQASLAYGTFYQTPERRYISSLVDLDFTRANHYIAQYQKVTGLITLRAELFYKKYQNLIKTTVDNNREVAISNSGKGYARGFELFYRDKKTIKMFDYWISYSYLDTKRDFQNYPYEIQPSFATKHTGNLVMKKFVPSLKTQFNANYVYATGRPYYNIRYDNSAGKFNIFDQGKTIDYHSLSLSVNYLPNVFKQGANKFTVFVLSVSNVLGNDQVFGYNYSYNGSRKEAIVPPSKVFVYIGAFFSFGVDRSQDVINSNL